MSSSTWLVFSLNANHEAVDWICTLLATSNYSGEICVLQNLDSDWAFTVRLIMPENRSMAQAILEKLSPLHRSGLIDEPEIAVTSEKPQAFPPFIYRIGDRFAITSTETAEPIIPLKIDPTLTFGSGFHPATQLCLQLLERHVRSGMNCLDLGCGSGILSVAIAKLGGQVLALDNDRRSVEATQAAIDRNQVTSLVTVKEGSLGQGSTLGHWMGGEMTATVPKVEAIAEFDLIVANILARVHIALAGEYQRSLRPNGVLITAGYTNEYESEIDAAFAEAGFERIDQISLNEWIAMAYRLTTP